ncbi:MAG: helix-turn-helix domain-containing protein [Alistipes senegalensis]|nr:helix-turn-helix domain-containing protein [Bacteroides cellulosilyticus]MCM1352803.1 helix-turn-helix domain-containing protein [Alistipes senegalensis]
MKIIVAGSKVYRELVDRIEKIEQKIIAQETPMPSDKEWVDGETVCRYLKISKRTLQRLRSQRIINYSLLNHKIYYTLEDVKRMLRERMIHGGHTVKTNN